MNGFEVEKRRDVGALSRFAFAVPVVPLLCYTTAPFCPFHALNPSWESCFFLVVSSSLPLSRLPAFDPSRDEGASARELMLRGR